MAANLSTERAYVIFNYLEKYYPNFDGEIPGEWLYKLFREYSALGYMSCCLFQHEMIYVGILQRSGGKNFCLNQKNFEDEIKKIPIGQKKFLDIQIEKLSKKIKY
jgi:hypothetical protein